MFRRALRLLLGQGETPTADTADLFDVTTARVTLGSRGYDATGTAGLCFRSVDSVNFERVVEEVDEVLDVAALETQVDHAVVETDHGYTWVTLSATTFDDLITAVYMAAETLIEGGYSTHLLSAVLGFRTTGGGPDDVVPSEAVSGDTGQAADDRRPDPDAYWVYNFKRGRWYPFAPMADGTRDTDREVRLRTHVDDEMAVETDPERRYPYWDVPF